METHYGPNISEYKLPVTDCDEGRRNFKGYQKDEIYTLEDMKSKGQYGTSDTDEETDTDKDSGVEATYRKKGKVYDWSGQNLGFAEKKNPHTKLFGNG